MPPLPEIDKTWYAPREEGLRERVAVGGVVVRLERGNLFVAMVREIESRGDTIPGYVLPKGGLEEGETRDQGARREIQEEVGLTEVTWLAHLHTVERLDLYREYWAINHYDLFVTDQVSGDILDKEHHFDMGWFPLDSPPDMFWPCEQHVLDRYRKDIYDLVIGHQNPQKRKVGFM